MTLYEYFVVYPEGGCQEIPSPLRLDQLVDLNGLPLPLPLASPRQIAYRVVKLRHDEERGVYPVYHYLELVGATELLSYCR